MINPNNTTICHTYFSKKDACDADQPLLDSNISVIVDVITGVPGSGKSALLLEKAANEPGRYLFAFPTTELADEQASRFRNHAPAQVPVMIIHSKSPGKGSVAKRLDEVHTKIAGHDHAAVFITHEAMLCNDLSSFSGWHVCIDEVPHSIRTGTIKLRHSIGHYQQAFSLVPLGGVNWSRVVPLGKAQSWKELEEDTLGSSIKEFTACAHRPAELLMNLVDFKEGKCGGEVSWMHLWTPLQLADCASITIASSSFSASLLKRVCESAFSDVLTFREQGVESARCAQPSIQVHYFTSRHEGSTKYWDTREGHRCMVAVEKWLTANVPDLGYFSGNECFTKQLGDRVAGAWEKPKLAGLNRLRHATSCAFLYSAKKVPQDKPLTDVFGVSEAEFTRAREDEDIYQFVCRGAIRDPDFSGDYSIYLYSRGQAERLQQRLHSAGYAHVAVSGLPEAGIMSVTREAPRRTKVLTQQQLLARAEKKKADARERQRACRAKRKLAPLYGHPCSSVLERAR